MRLKDGKKKSSFFKRLFVIVPLLASVFYYFFSVDVPVASPVKVKSGAKNLFYSGKNERGDVFLIKAQKTTACSSKEILAENLIFSLKGKNHLFVRSNLGSYYPDQKKLLLNKNVSLLINENSIIETDSIALDCENETAETLSPVKACFHSSVYLSSLKAHIFDEKHVIFSKNLKIIITDENSDLIP